MGLSQIEIERCLGRIMTQAMDSSNISADVIGKFLGVLISSEVMRQERQGGRAFHQHPRDPLFKPRPGNEMIMTTPAAVGSTEAGQVSPMVFLVMSSVPAAIRIREELREVQLQLPIGRAIKMTPVPETPLMETGLPATQQRLQEQEKAARREALDWVQEVQSCLKACEAAPSNMLVVSKLATKMEEGKDLMTRAHLEVRKQMTDILRHYDKGSETASESVLLIGTQFGILYTSMYSPAEAATPRACCLWFRVSMHTGVHRFLAYELLVNPPFSGTLAFSLRLAPFLPVSDSPANWG
jgi:hypothetical protein